MKISDYTQPNAGHWTVDQLGWPGGHSPHPPDDVRVGEKIRFALHDQVIVARMVSQRFGDPDLSKAGPSWEGLPFKIIGSDRHNNVTLLSLRLIYDDDRGEAVWHEIEIEGDSEGGIVCAYHDVVPLSGTGRAPLQARLAKGSAGHAGTWHAGGD